MNMFSQYEDHHESYLSVRLLIQAYLATLLVPNALSSINIDMSNVLSNILVLLDKAMELHQEKQQYDEMGELDYSDLLERVQGDAFRENDWGFDEDQDVNDDFDEDMRNVSLKQLEALSGLEGDCVEIDDRLFNEVTDRNVFVAFQETIMVGLSF